MSDSLLDSLSGNSTLDSIRQANYEKYKDRFKDSTGFEVFWLDT